MSAEDTKVRDLQAITCNFLGIPLDKMGGWGENGGFMLEPEGDAFTDKIGADGSVVRSKTYEGRSTLTLILLQSAGANAVLSGALALDSNSDNGAGVGPLLIRDRQGKDVITGTKTWVMGLPKTINFKGTAENLEWKIRIADTKAFLGGN